jgi:hypothetical protein
MRNILINGQKVHWSVAVQIEENSKRLFFWSSRSTLVGVEVDMSNRAASVGFIIVGMKSIDD